MVAKTTDYLVLFVTSLNDVTYIDFLFKNLISHCFFIFSAITMYVCLF